MRDKVVPHPRTAPTGKVVTGRSRGKPLHLVAIAIISLLPFSTLLSGCNLTDATAASPTPPNGLIYVVFNDRSDATPSRQKAYRHTFLKIVEHGQDLKTPPLVRLYGFSNEAPTRGLPLYFDNFPDPEQPAKLDSAFSKLVSQTPSGKGTFLSAPLSTLLSDCNRQRTPIVAIFLTDGGATDWKALPPIITKLNKAQNLKAVYALHVDSTFRVQMKDVFSPLASSGKTVVVAGAEDSSQVIETIGN